MRSKQLPRVSASRIAAEVETLVAAEFATSNALLTLSSNGPSIFVFNPAASRVVKLGINKATTRMEFAEPVNNFVVSLVAMLLKQIIAG